MVAVGFRYVRGKTMKEHISKKVYHIIDLRFLRTAARAVTCPDLPCMRSNKRIDRSFNITCHILIFQWSQRRESN